MSDDTATELGDLPDDLDELPPAGISPAFAAAMDMVFGDEDPEKAGEGGEAAGAPAGGGETPAPAPEGTGAEGVPAPASDAGTQPAGEAAAGDQPSGGPENPFASSGLSSTDALPLFAEAGTKINERLEASYRDLAINELREEIDPIYLQMMRLTPRELIGKQVPSFNKDGNETLRDRDDAKDWLETLNETLSREVELKVERKMEETRDVTNTLQESIQLFQNNTDMIPNTKNFDPELVSRFYKVAKHYTQTRDGKIIGFAVNVQPLINEIRQDLAKERATKPVAPSKAQERVATQPRRDNGTWVAPQEGITSSAPMSGGGSDDDDFEDAFWKNTVFGKIRKTGV